MLWSRAWLTVLLLYGLYFSPHTHTCTHTQTQKEHTKNPTFSSSHLLPPPTAPSYIPLSSYSSLTPCSSPFYFSNHLVFIYIPFGQVICGWRRMFFFFSLSFNTLEWSLLPLLVWPHSPVNPVKSTHIRPPLWKPLESKDPGFKSCQIPSMGKKYLTSVARDLVLAPK